MLVKAVLIVCVQTFMVQTVFSACAGGPAGIGALGLGYNGLAGFGYGVGLAGYRAGWGCGGVASTGGGLPTSSVSPVAPVGISLVSDNAYEGILAAGGNLPFLGTVAVEGLLPTSGAGAVSYGCGSGAIGIGSEGPIATGITSPESFAPSAGIAGIGALSGASLTTLGGINGFSVGRGLAGYGLGCGCY